ncbi:branched-chain amino acid ABC transporter permease [Candidatus Bipolaricaulota bacterium]|nr:branched-chain amino acid ABC transporter permease [Candidatus Bipolaricaulota bacterium]MBS3792503.1 branched-chain amino acid ABC transporter permease [Candidatus Bipolaricaulota bacterium]
MLSYFVSYLIMASTYGIAALALNLQWGFTGLMNFGIGTFYFVGAYTSALLTTSASPDYVGGFGLPFIVGLIGAVALSGLLAYLLAFPALRLRGGFFAISMLAISETIRLIVKNEKWLTNGVWGIRGIPQPTRNLVGADLSEWIYLGIAGILLYVFYRLTEVGVRSPWGRMLNAVREDEKMAEMSGKNSWNVKMQSFVFGSMIMGVAGALYAHYVGFISPSSFTPLMATFIVWLMILLGGTGSNKGVIFGAFVVWGVWIGSEFFIDFLPSGITNKAGFVRMLLMGILLDAILLLRPQGLFGREKIISKLGSSSNE